jgi:multiple sugar transport system permease protein
MTRKKNISSTVFHVLCILFGLFSLYPIIWMMASSLKESQKVFVDAYNLLPNPMHFDNYSRGWSGAGGLTFATYFKNTFVIVLITTFGTLLSCSMVAYGFARQNFKFKNFWFVTVMITMMLPGQIIMIPQYIMFHKIGWTNTILPLVVPAFFGGAFFIFLMMQFIRGLPIDIDEAAKIDGCNSFQIYYRIIVPLIKPALITAAIFQFYWSWDDFLAPLIYLSKPELYTVSIALRNFNDPSSQTDWGAMFAMGCLSIIPPILVFFIFQKYIVEGISTTGMKA